MAISQMASFLLSPLRNIHHKMHNDRAGIIYSSLNEIRTTRPTGGLL